MCKVVLHHSFVTTVQNTWFQLCPKPEIYAFSFDSQFNLNPKHRSARFGVCRGLFGSSPQKMQACSMPLHTIQSKVKTSSSPSASQQNGVLCKDCGALIVTVYPSLPRTRPHTQKKELCLTTWGPANMFQNLQTAQAKALQNPNA